MNVLDSVVIDLDKTATYAARVVTFYPGDEPGSGLLVIRLRKGKTSRGRWERDEYQIEEEPNLFAGGRKFVILKLTAKPDEEGVYELFTGAGMLPAKCGCTAGQCKVSESCRHRDAIAKLIEEGVL